MSTRDQHCILPPDCVLWKDTETLERRQPTPDLCFETGKFDPMRALEYEPIPMKLWFPDALLPTHDTPLVFLLEWLVGELVDAINCAALVSETNPYVPITSGHTSEWILSMLRFISQTRGLCQNNPTAQDMEIVAARHVARLPDPNDVERAKLGIMTHERATYAKSAIVNSLQQTSCGDSRKTMRSALDFAPRQVPNTSSTPSSSASYDAAISDTAEVYIMHFMRTRIEEDDTFATAIGAITHEWLSNLTEHYFAASQAAHARSSGTYDPAPHRCMLDAVEIMAGTLSLQNSPKIKECVCGCFDRAMAILATESVRGRGPNWNPHAIGYPFFVWSMLAILPENLKQMYYEITRLARGKVRAIPEIPAAGISFSDISTRTMVSELRAKTIRMLASVEEQQQRVLSKRSNSGNSLEPDKDCCGSTSLAAVDECAAESASGCDSESDKPSVQDPRTQRFVDRIEIPGMQTLLDSGWKCSPGNVDAVTSLAFRMFVLEVKREVRNGPKASRGRAMLPTHEFIQTIVKAVEGKAHMYGSDLLPNGAWVDDYHPTKNPSGCPPWVLVACVAVACVDGMRHVVSQVSELRRALEKSRGRSAVVVPEQVPRAKRRAKPPKIFSVGGLDICFPPTFLNIVAKLMNGELPLSRVGFLDPRKDSRSASPMVAAGKCCDAKERTWYDLEDAEKDELLIECVLTCLKGFATFGRFVRKCSCIPTWLGAYICEVGDLFASSAPNVGAIRKFLEMSPNMSEWMTTYAAKLEEASRTPVVEESVATPKSVSEIISANATGAQLLEKPPSDGKKQVVTGKKRGRPRKNPLPRDAELTLQKRQKRREPPIAKNKIATASDIECDEKKKKRPRHHHHHRHKIARARQSSKLSDDDDDDDDSGCLPETPIQREPKRRRISSAEQDVVPTPADSQIDHNNATTPMDKKEFVEMFISWATTNEIVAGIRDTMLSRGLTEDAFVFLKEEKILFESIGKELQDLMTAMSALCPPHRLRFVRLLVDKDVGRPLCCGLEHADALYGLLQREVPTALLSPEMLKRLVACAAKVFG